MLEVTEGKYIVVSWVTFQDKPAGGATKAHKKMIHGLGLAVNWRSEETLPIPAQMSPHGKNETCVSLFQSRE